MATKNKDWLPELQEHRKVLRAEVEAKFPDPLDSERLEYLLAQANSLGDGVEPSTLIKCGNALLYGLVHMERQEQIQQAVLNRSEKLFGSVIKALKTKASASLAKQFAEELNDILSQIHRRSGDHLRAAWYDGLARQIGFQDTDMRRHHRLLTTANRLMRLGDLNGSIERLRSLVQLATGDIRIKAKCQLVVGLRLKCDFDSALTLIADIFSDPAVLPDSAIRQEMEWQEKCISVQQHGDLEGLLGAVRRGQPHSHPSYILESVLWETATSKDLKNRQTYSVYSMARHGELRAKSHPKLYDIANALQKALDPHLPKETRIECISEVVFSAHELFTVDLEVLAYRAAGRILDFLNAPDLAAVPNHRFQNLCMNMSGGTFSDIIVHSGKSAA